MIKRPVGYSTLSGAHGIQPHVDETIEGSVAGDDQVTLPGIFVVPNEVLIYPSDVAIKSPFA